MTGPARIAGRIGVPGHPDVLSVDGPADLHHRGDAIEVVLDGVVYNRASLVRDGESDSALIARLVGERGVTGALEALNGDFAVAVLDKTSHTLHLARDRFGLQPLYHADLAGGGVAFASQPGPLLGLPGVSFDPDPRFLGLFAGSHYRTFDNDITGSPYRDVSQIPAAHVLSVAPAGTTLTRWWALTAQEDLPGDATLADTYRELLADAVGIRVASADKPGFTLSGGMDSSTVIANAYTVTGTPQDAFSTVYKDPTFDEREDITPMLDEIVGTWHPLSVDDPDVFDVVQQMIAAHDEPVATATWLSHFLLVQQVADMGYDVLFGGLGGDELNAGEYEYFPFHFADLHVAGREDDLEAEIAKWVEYHDHPIHMKNRAVVDEHFTRVLDLDHPGRCLPDMARLLRYVDAVNPEVFDLSTWRPIMDMPFDSYLKNRTYQDIFRETAPCCLRAEDRHTNRFGIRRADPFFDHRLAELMFRVPGSMKIRNGVTKRLLREATKGILPAETRTRIKKTGWNAPAHQWFVGKGAEPLRDLIASQPFADHAVYDRRRVLELLAEHEQIVTSGAAKENHMMFFWQLVNVELWLRDLDSRRRAAVHG